MLTLDPIIFSIETLIRSIPPQQAIALFDAQAKSLGITMEETENGEHRISTPIGKIDLIAHSDETTLKLTSPDKQSLYVLKEALEHQLSHAFNDQEIGLDWTGDLPTGATPPNFCEMSVVKSEQISRIYQRITVTAENIERFFDGAMHFRLLIPKKAGQTPQWPYIDEHGKTIWPEDDKELLRPIYTVRQFDAANKTLDFDVFLHEGGPTAEWSLNVGPGAKVGFMGPVGSWIPKGDFMLLAGDETAIPAICRILENIPEQTEGKIFLSIEKDGDQLPIPELKNMDLEWIVRPPEDHDCLFEAAKAVQLPQDKSAFIWLAAKKSVARKARTHFRDTLGFGKDNCHLAGYWEEG